MQQECPSDSIMTSRRRSQTALRTARFALAAIASSMLGACAALPDDAPVVEQLDSETGLTVTRLGHPIELYRETFLKDPAGRFAFIGPFETNHMGQARTVPVDRRAHRTRRGLGARRRNERHGARRSALRAEAADFAGINKSPYKIPTPWSAMYYFKVDDGSSWRGSARRRISTVRMLEVGKNGPVKTRVRPSGSWRTRA